jgi:outer membrane lipoprotein-sorting protein
MVTCTPIASALTSVRTGLLFRFSTTSLWIKTYDTVTTVTTRFAVRSSLLVCLTAVCALAQPIPEYLARMDRFAKTFTGAKAAIQSITHTNGVPDDDIEKATVYVKRAGGKTQLLIDFTDPNPYKVFFLEKAVYDYRPRLREAQEYNLAQYKDVAQKLFSLGFGMPGSELSASYEIKKVEPAKVDNQSATHLELIPKSPEVLSRLKSVDLWISDATLCPIRQTFHLSDGSYRSAQFSNMELNPKLPSNIFDLPKGTKIVKAN